MIWIFLEVTFYLLIIFLIIDFIRLRIKRTEESSMSNFNNIMLSDGIQKRYDDSRITTLSTSIKYHF